MQLEHTFDWLLEVVVVPLNACMDANAPWSGERVIYCCSGGNDRAEWKVVGSKFCPHTRTCEEFVHAVWKV